MDALREWLSTPMDFTKMKDEFMLRVWTLELFPEGEAEEFFLRARQEWRSALQH